MIFEILKALMVLLIAVPFIYIVLNVVWDIVKRTFDLSKRLKPVLVKVRANNHDPS